MHQNGSKQIKWNFYVDTAFKIYIQNTFRQLKGGITYSTRKTQGFLQYQSDLEITDFKYLKANLIVAPSAACTALKFYFPAFTKIWKCLVYGFH